MSQYNISKQLVFLMVVLSLVFTIIAGTIGVWMDYSREMTLIEKRIQQIKTSYVPPLAESLWVEADKMLQVQLQGIYELPDMQYAEIQRDSSAFLMLGTKRENSIQAHSFPIIYRNDSGKKKVEMAVGNLNFQVDLKQVYSRLGKRAFTTILGQAFVLFCVASCMLFLLQKIVVSPLLTLRGSAEKVSAGDFDHTIKLKQQDEFGDLSHSLEFMRSTIKSKMNELHLANDNLKSVNLDLQSEIEERKKVENDLRVAEEKYRKIFENAVEGIFQTSRDGTILGANPTLAKMFGYESVEKVFETSSNIADYYVHHEDRKKFVRKITEEGKVMNFEAEFYKRDKQKFWLSISARLIEGDEPLFEGMVMDITARKEREKAEKDRKTAEAANEAKSRFLANMSHEIRTPMNAIIGLTDLALRTELTLKQADYLRKISLSANSLLGIINDILDFSKIEAGKLDLENITFNLNEVLENLASLITIKTEEKGVELIFDIQKDLPLNLIGDPLRLGQVLVNLANNAVKFTEHGQIIIKITARDVTLNETDSNAVLVFSVTDSGIGMTPDQVSKLFSSFSQADSSTTRKFGGTGLGLSISKSLVEMMDGEIWVESQKDIGSTFWFTAAFGLQKSQPFESQRLEGRFSGMRVLVVDDNATSREIMMNVLRDFSFNPDEAATGANALEMVENDLSSSPYKLILMDWRMPGMDGVETAKRIKNLSGLKEKPHIIMLTAFGREEVRRRAEAVGIDGFLVKPVNRSILFDSIMNLFGGETIGKIELERHSFHHQPENYQFKNVRILLAEDNEINQQVAVELLESGGIEVDVVENGSLAVEAVCGEGAQTRYDLVLMDIQMPEMDGFTATGLIRESERQNGRKPLPILALTAHALAAEKERCRKEGMDDHISKPIDPRLLFTAIERWVSPDKVVTDPSAGEFDSLKKNSESSTAATGSLPAKLAGVDLTAGLARMAGNSELYAQILRKFSNKYRELPIQILQAIEAEDLQTATDLAHTIKGVSGNIGAQETFEAFLALENALKSHETDSLKQLYSAAYSEIETLFEAIDDWKKISENYPEMPVEQDRKTGGDVVLDRNAIAQTINKLQELLSDYNMDAESLVDELGSLTKDRFTQQIDELRELVEELEFDKALTSLKCLAAEIG